jgi:hypothetical protein
MARVSQIMTQQDANNNDNKDLLKTLQSRLLLYGKFEKIGLHGNINTTYWGNLMKIANIIPEKNNIL